jgi:hypothetical protein
VQRKFQFAVYMLTLGLRLMEGHLVAVIVEDLDPYLYSPVRIEDSEVS